MVHLPATSATDPAITVFRNDISPVAKDKANLVVAHMAKVPPADIRVDDKVLFENIANGESLNLTVPVATYEVAIVPTGETEPVILGPAELTVKGGAVNRVYAIGDPGKKTMNVAVHIIPTGTTGSGKPSDVNTGTGGQAAGQGPVLGVTWCGEVRRSSASTAGRRWAPAVGAVLLTALLGGCSVVSSSEALSPGRRSESASAEAAPTPVPSARVGRPGRTERVTFFRSSWSCLEGRGLPCCRPLRSTVSSRCRRRWTTSAGGMAAPAPGTRSARL